jgi:nicotinamidase-related amidase
MVDYMNNFTKRLSPESSALLLVDYQPQMLAGVAHHDRTKIRDNVLGLAKGASLFKIPTVLTSINQDGFGGKFFPELTELFPQSKLIDRVSSPTYDALDDPVVLEALKKTGRKQVVVSGLWTSICFAFTALHCLKEDYQVFGVMDTAGSESLEAHEAGVSRMIQAGVIPTTWMQIVFEWLNDWRNPLAADASKIFAKHNAFFDKAGSYYASLSSK